MDAGDLRHVVTIEQRDEITNAFGETVFNWTVWADNVRAAIEDMSTAERNTALQAGSEVTTRIRIRFRPGVNDKMRIRHATGAAGSPQLVDFYDIQGITRDKETGRTELQLVCVRRTQESYLDGNRA